MGKVKHSYFKDIRKMFFLYAMVPVALLTVVGLTASWFVWKHDLERTTQSDNAKMADILETAVTSYSSVIEKVAKERYVLDGMTVDQRVSIFREIYDISNKLDRRGYLYVFDRHMESVVSGTSEIPNYLDMGNYLDWGIFRSMRSDPGKVQLKVVRDENSDSMKLILGKAMVFDGEVQGFVTFVMDSMQFGMDIARLESQTVIADEYGWVLAGSNYSLLDSMERFIINPDPKGIHEDETDRYYILSQKILDGRLVVHSIFSMGNQTRFFQSIAALISFIFIMLIAFVYISTKNMAAKKTRDLYTIIGAMEQVQVGDLDSHIDSVVSDEFKVISDSYNIMVDSLKEQIEKNKEMGKLVAVSQSRQLQSQFNPHFLFNTLENIRFMSKLDPDSASRMILNLSTLLRYSIDTIEETVTFEKDAAYTENYMNILKARFNERFSYTIDISDEAKVCIIPKLIIQPMIENAVKYGFGGRDCLDVTIKGEVADGLLKITCGDNGTGMDTESLTAVRRLLEQQTNRSGHSGLYNIHRRIQLTYGMEYGVEIFSEKEKGTLLRVILPARRDERVA